MSVLSLKKTFLLERSTDRLQFHTESAPLLKGALLLGVVAFFLITYTVRDTASWVRPAVIVFCLLGFLLMGNRFRVTIDREQHRITSDRSFYFIRRAQARSFADCCEVTVVPARFGTQVQLVFKDRQSMIVGVSSSSEEAEIWRMAVSALVEK